MTVSKTKFYFLLIAVCLLCCFLYQAIWLFSKTTPGLVVSFGEGAGKRYKHIKNVTIRYVVHEQVYLDTYLRNGLPDTAKTASIRYLTFAPSISRVDTFVGNWGITMAIFIVLFLSISIIFLTKDLVPRGSVFIINKRKPFVRLATEVRHN
jgi:hypothetical protein